MAQRLIRTLRRAVASVTRTSAAPGQEPGDVTSVPPRAITASLSPSRASDFKTCPLLYRFRSVDRLPGRSSSAAVRGTLVHGVLERLFDLPPAERVEATARAMVSPEWDRLRAEDDALTLMFGADQQGLTEWLSSARDLVSAYFGLEDPTHFEPTARELLVEARLESGLLLRGYIDRVDEASDGRLRVVDYKTGASPRADFEATALFQLKFYALVIWRSRGVIPAQLKLIYLADRDTLSYSPDEDELLALERQVIALWAAVAEAIESRSFQPRPSRMCTWCDFQALCPTFGGTPPDFPDHVTLAAGAERRPQREVSD